MTAAWLIGLVLVMSGFTVIGFGVGFALGRQAAFGEVEEELARRDRLFPSDTFPRVLR